jgi:hypothetical protein
MLVRAIVLVVVMTALVVVVIGLHIWGAIQDGREEGDARMETRQALSSDALFVVVRKGCDGESETACGSRRG